MVSEWVVSICYLFYSFLKHVSATHAFREPELANYFDGYLCEMANGLR